MPVPPTRRASTPSMQTARLYTYLGSALEPTEVHHEKSGSASICMLEHQ